MFATQFFSSCTEALNKAAQSNSQCQYNMWQMPVAYWQTVSSIMGLRSNTATQLSTLWAECYQQLSTCKSPTEAAQCLQTYQQKATLCCTNLNLQTHQYRAELWHAWQVLGKRCDPNYKPTEATSSPSNGSGAQPSKPTATATATMASVAAQTAPTATQTAPQPTPTATPTYLKGWFVAGKTTPSAPKAVTPTPTANTATATPSITTTQPTPQPQPSVLESSMQQNAKDVAKKQQVTLPMAAAETSQEDDHTPMPMAVGQSFSSATPTISSTAESVMRSSSGATVASAAATRRSVLARHATRKGRLGRR